MKIKMTLQQVLTEALEDEYKACAMYRKVIDKFGPRFDPLSTLWKPRNDILLR